jgi:Rad3-related DNA helicase
VQSSAEAIVVPAWSYTVSVRSLCEFGAKAGDLDRRFTPSATATEGLKGQQSVAQRRGQDYETEVALAGQWGALRVRGRADGYDPRRACLEEVKTIRGRPEQIPENRRRLHWAQLQTYGALFCRQRGVKQVALALVYFDVESQTETELLELCGAQELQQAFEARCGQFIAWAEQEARHRVDRDAALQGLAFPRRDFRPGQRTLAEGVYRAAASGQCLLAQAPTGIGKTMGTLFPMLRALPTQGLDKLAFLTCKGTGRITALEALQELRDGTPGQHLRVLVMVAKEQACEHPDKACHGDACPLARGFYDRLAAAREEAIAAAWLDVPTQRRIALRHGLCPYYFGQELLRWADVLVGDVHHAFDPNGVLWGLMQALEWKLGLLVDEAHNLVERTRQMYSAELGLSHVRAALSMAPPGLCSSLEALLQACAELVGEQGSQHAVLDSLPDPFSQAVLSAAGALGAHFQRLPAAAGPLLEFHFLLQGFAQRVDTLAEHSLFELQVTPSDTTLAVRNIVPARFLRPRFKAMHTATLFSATLAPPDYAVGLLGLPMETGWINVPPAFPPENLKVHVAHRLSTRYAHRTRSLARLVQVLARQFDAAPGNYLAFFSSFDYLEQAAALLAQRRPGIPQWRQDRGMNPEARSAFLGRFVSNGQGIAFAVLGGVFAEGIDLPGTRLIGAFIATLGLPPVSELQQHIQRRLDKLFGAELGYADLVPAMQKVVQAAGRIQRTPEDKGTLWLLDDRYASPEVRRLLPAWWGLD